MKKYNSICYANKHTLATAIEANTSAIWSHGNHNLIIDFVYIAAALYWCSGIRTVPRRRRSLGGQRRSLGGQGRGRR